MIEVEIEVETLRKDMLQFILASQGAEAPFNKATTDVLILESLDDLVKRFNNQGSKLIKLWALEHSLLNSVLWEERVAASQDLFKENFSDLYPWHQSKMMAGIKMRDNFVSSVSSRSKALAGLNSPFLDSGFQFISYSDLQLNLVRLEGLTKPAMRLNLMVLHLAGRGLSEMGEGTNSWDQHYATISEYINHVYTKDEAILKKEREIISRSKLKNKETLLNVFEDRIWELVQAWVKEKNNSELNTLLEQTQRKADESLPN